MTSTGNPGHSPHRSRETGSLAAATAGQRQPARESGGKTVDAGILAQVLAALTHDSAGQAGQQAWTALAALAGRDRAETAAIEAARTGASTDPSRLAGVLAGRAGTDPRFAAGLREWLAGTRAMLAAGHRTASQATGPMPGTVIHARHVFGGIGSGGPPAPAA